MPIEDSNIQEEGDPQLETHAIEDLEERFRVSRSDITVLNQLLLEVRSLEPSQARRILQQDLTEQLLLLNGRSGRNTEYSALSSIDYIDPTDPAALITNIRVQDLKDRLRTSGNSRNLLNLRHSDASRSHLRLINCDLSEAWNLIYDTKAIELISLPEPEDEEEDEDFPEFQQQLEELQHIDEEHLNLLATAEDGELEEEAAEEEERRLRNIVRGIMGMPPILDIDRNSLRYRAEVAVRADINPDFDLGLGQSNSESGLDSGFQTLHFYNQLMPKLSHLSRSYRLSITETGMNTLYLCFGFLEWTDERSNNTRSRTSPIIMLPVELERIERSNLVRYTLGNDGEEAFLNPVLQAELKRNNLVFSDFVNGEDEITSFLANISRQVSSRDWKVRNFLTVGIFQSSSAIMARDLEDENWPLGQTPDIHPVLSNLLGASAGDFGYTAQDRDVDSEDMRGKLGPTVLDTDPSQYSAIVDVLEGRNLVISGPPGTGKSQTISNLIAALMDRGKSILFVAEKIAALDVVKKRLDDVGLGPLILELHSVRAQRQHVLSGIRQSRNLNRRRIDHTGLDEKIALLTKEIENIRSYGRRLEEKVAQSNLSLFDLIGTVARLEAEWFVNTANGENQAPTPRSLYNGKWSISESISLNEKDVHRISENLSKYADSFDSIVANYKNIEGHPWGWVDKRINAVDVPEFMNSLDDFRESLGKILNILDPLYDLEILDKDETTSAFLKDWNTRVVSSLHNLDIEFHRDLLQQLIGGLPIPEVQTFADSVTRFSELVSNIDDDVNWESRSHALKILDGVCEFLVKHRLAGIQEIHSLRTSSEKSIREINELTEVIDEFSKVLGLYRPTFSPQKASILLNTLNNATTYDLKAISAVANVSQEQESAELVEEAVKLADGINTLKTQFKDVIRFDAPRGLSTLRNALFSLENAGFLGRLKPSVRDANKTWTTISLRPNIPSREVVMEEIRACIKYKMLKEQLDNNSGITNLFGSDFRSADTDLLPYTQAVELWESIQSFLELEDDISFTTELFERLWSISPDRYEQLANLYNSQFLARFAAQLNPDQLESKTSNFALFLAEHKTASEHAANLIRETETITLKPNLNMEHIFTIRSYVGELISVERAIQESEVHSVMSNLNLDNSDSRETIYRTCSFLESLAHIVPPTPHNKFWESVLDDPDNTLKQIKHASTNLPTMLEELGKSRGYSESFSRQSPLCVSISDMDKVIGISLDKRSEFNYFNDFLEISETVNNTTATQLVAKYRESNNFPLSDYWKYLHYSNLIRDHFRQFPDLNNYSGLTMESARTRLADLDKELRTLIANKILNKPLKSDPPEGVGRGPRRAYTEMALLDHQLGLTRPSRSIRDVINSAPNSLAIWKPCFMMSPASVARFLEPANFAFDVVIIDEASQMRTEEAIGAIARGKQLVVVGDQQQLPPTSFFQRTQDTDDDYEDTEDSILDAAISGFGLGAPLRWHYRSRHEKLIEFSNHHFYNNDLITFPSGGFNKHFGVQSHYVSDGVYSGRQTQQRGRGGINVNEAHHVIDAALTAIENNPDRSLGIVTMNISQSDYLNELIDLALETNQRLRDYINEWAGTISPFFIKNLENVQGDERDHIIISTLYGRNTEGGSVPQRFGPINSPNGHRRLNVLFTRAREKIDLFTSLKPADIRTTPSSARGINILKSYLEFAERGIIETGTETTDMADSDFEVAVAERLQQRGFKITHQVGVSGFRIDLGVEHENYQYGFIAGIECDGKTYHNSRSARDSDVLRQAILEEQGWKIYRIWSTDWFSNQDGETEKLINYLSSRLEELIGQANIVEYASLSNDAAEYPLVDDSLTLDLDFGKFFQRGHERIWVELKSWITDGDQFTRDDTNLIVDIQSRIRDYGTVPIAVEHEGVNLLKVALQTGWQIPDS